MVDWKAAPRRVLTRALLLHRFSPLKSGRWRACSAPGSQGPQPTPKSQTGNLFRISPAVAVNPDVLPLGLLSRRGVHVLGEGGRAQVEELAVRRDLLGVAALHRLGLPAPDVVQLEEDAGFHLQHWWLENRSLAERHV